MVLSFLPLFPTPDEPFRTLPTLPTRPSLRRSSPLVSRTENTASLCVQAHRTSGGWSSRDLGNPPPPDVPSAWNSWRQHCSVRFTWKLPSLFSSSTSSSSLCFYQYHEKFLPILPESPTTSNLTSTYFSRACGAIPGSIPYKVMVDPPRK